MGSRLGLWSLSRGLAFLRTLLGAHSTACVASRSSRHRLGKAPSDANQALALRKESPQGALHQPALGSQLRAHPRVLPGSVSRHFLWPHTCGTQIACVSHCHHLGDMLCVSHGPRSPPLQTLREVSTVSVKTIQKASSLTFIKPCQEKGWHSG